MTQEHNWSAVLTGLFLCTVAVGNPLENITITTADGKTVADDLSGIKTKPLRNRTDRTPH